MAGLRQGLVRSLGRLTRRRGRGLPRPLEACRFAVEPLEPRMLLSFAPAGPEFRVNTYTTGYQKNPSVAVDAGGNFVIAWQSDRQDGVYAQRYDAAGVPRGGEFRVNTYTTVYEGNPSVAVDAGGNFVIAWQSYGQDGSEYGVYAQRYDSAGLPRGGEFRVKTHTAGYHRYQEAPSVAVDADGDFVIAWESVGQIGSGNGVYNGVYAQRYDAAGVARGGEFRVHTETANSLNGPSVAVDADGDFVIAWPSQDSSDSGVYARRYDAAGMPRGGEFRVNTHTASSQYNPRVAVDADGDFVIAWDSVGQDGSGTGVYAQRYDAAGLPRGGEFRVNTDTLNGQSSPSVAVDADGDFVIAWQSSDSSENGIYAQRYQVVQGPPILLSPGVGASPGATIATSMPTFEWQADGAAEEYGLYISRRNPNGSYRLVFNSRERGIAITGTDTSLTVPAGVLEDGGQYRWNMNARTAAGWSGYTPRLYFVVSSVPAPAAPTGLAASAAGASAIQLQWNTSPGATNYRLYRARSATGPWDRPVYFGPDLRREDVSLQSNTTYYYRAVGVNAGGESAYSTVASATTATLVRPPPPANLRATVSGGNSVSLAWDGTLADGEYVIERSILGTGIFIPIGAVPAGLNTFIDRSHANSTPETTYEYRIAAAVRGVVSDFAQSVRSTLTRAYDETAAIVSGVVDFVTNTRENVAKLYRWSWKDEEDKAGWDLVPDPRTLSLEAGFWQDRKTIILTHGWNDALGRITNPRTGATDVNDPDDFISIFAQNFDASRGFNLLAVDWYAGGSRLGSDPNHDSFPDQSLDAVFDIKTTGPMDALLSSTNGISAAKPLAAKLAGIDPTKVALIGHSNGAGFMASLARSLYVATGKKVAELVALDAPIFTKAYDEVRDAVPFVGHVSNYYMPLLFTTLNGTETIFSPKATVDALLSKDAIGVGWPIWPGTNVTNFELSKDISNSAYPDPELLGHNRIPKRYAHTSDRRASWGFNNSSFAVGDSFQEGYSLWQEKAPTVGAGFERSGQFVPFYLAQVEDVIRGLDDAALELGRRAGDTANSIWDATVSGAAAGVRGGQMVVQKTTDAVGDAAIWIGSRIPFFASDARATAIGPVIGAAHGPVLASIDLRVPAGTSLLNFDLTVRDDGNNDRLVIALGTDVIGEVDLAAHKQLGGGTLAFWAGDHAGRETTLHFYMPSSESSTANFTIGNVEFVQSIPSNSVAARRLFYGNTAVGVAATSDRIASLPGERLRPENVSTYSRGINGVLLDVAGIPAGAGLTAEDFAVEVGAGSNPAIWSTGPRPSGVSILRGAGVAGTDRVTLTWPDHVIRNTWMRVTMLPTTRTGLLAPDIFYFGNLVGHTGNDRGTPTVNATDLARTRENVGKTTAAVLATYDFNRDGVINVRDMTIVRANQRRSLPLFTAPANTPAAAAFSEQFVTIAPPTRAAARPPRRGLLDGDPAGLLA